MSKYLQSTLTSILFLVSFIPYTYSQQYDFGDAPDDSNGTSPGNYRTLLSDNGPRHVSTPKEALYLGEGITFETDGQPTINADGDTDDGVELGILTASTSLYCVSVQVVNEKSTEATLYGWLDTDQNGVFDSDEIFLPATIDPETATTVEPCIFISDELTNGEKVYARFRITTDGLPSGEEAYGEASDGEVEDYLIEVGANNTDFQLQKTAEMNDENENGELEAGETIQYTYKVYFSGDTDIYDLLILENAGAFTGAGNLPSPVYVSGGSELGGDPSAYDLSGDGSDSPLVFEAEYVLTKDDVRNGTITNQASVEGLDFIGNVITDESDDPNNPTDADEDGDGEPDDPTVFTTFTVLPVELLTFKATGVDSDAELYWKTASEINNSHFNIQRSEDGIHFRTIARVQGAGNTDEEQTYSYIDKNAALVGRELFYRLEQVDFNGTSDITSVRSVRFSQKVTPEVKVFPNPAKRGEDVVLQAKDIEMVEVYNLEGMSMFNYQLSTIRNTTTIQTDHLSSGIYLLIINGTITKKLIIE